MNAHSEQARTLARRRWRVVGQVQGVGFRPFVYHLARRCGLSGFVRNGADGVTVECQGDIRGLRAFARALRRERPALAKLRKVRSERIDVDQEEREFRIEESQGHCGAAEVTVDTAVCDNCLEELFSPEDRRFGHPLINCTQCGPRFSIVKRTPYDRANTTMADFEMCPRCRGEYEDPADRRFHAQPVACHDCGAKLSIVDTRGRLIDADPIAHAVALLESGGIVAIKGIGGFHLAVRADWEPAVRRLRNLKRRDYKPFAVMCAGLAEAARIVELSQGAQEELLSPAAPIVLATKKDDGGIAEAVAPGNHRLGVMLPYTPVHHLIFRAASKFRTLVMTSGNVSDEPLVIENTDAIERLGKICDAILWHDRGIERGVDDSVLIDCPGGMIPVRRARGYVPGEIEIGPGDISTSGICMGGELKNTVAVVRDAKAILSQHMGDLTHAAAYAAFRKSIDDLMQLFAIEPEWVAVDKHPVYLSTQYGAQFAAERGLPVIAVQHHHAHAAALLAEHNLGGPIIAVVCDGTGYGDDGTIWGGEVLLADRVDSRRIGGIKPLRLPGGDAAARETRRCALALLYQAYGEGFVNHPAARKLFADPMERLMLGRMISNNVSCATSSGAGRVFDAVAALLGLCEFNHFEAMAAMRLESAAGDWPVNQPDLFVIKDGQIDLGPAIRRLVESVERGRHVKQLAAEFHEQFARGFAAAALWGAEQTGIRTVGLSGGVFCNQRITSRMVELLEAKNVKVLRHGIVPPNDGGIALGQATVASARWAGRKAGA